MKQERSAIPRFRFIDEARGVAMLLMVAVHSFDFWMYWTADSIQSFYWKSSHFIGSLSAPLFLFIAGFSALILIEKASLPGQNGTPGTTLRPFITLFTRGWAIFFSGFLFNFLVFCLPDRKGHTLEETLLIVQILHCIGLSLVFLSGMALIPAHSLTAGVLLFCCFASGGMVLWNCTLPAWVPPYMATLLRGMPNQAFFPIFPWCCFVMAGFTAGKLYIAAWRCDKAEHLMKLLFFAGFMGTLLAFSSLVLSGRTKDIIAMGMDEKVFYHMHPVLIIFWLGAVLTTTSTLYLLTRRGKKPGPPGILEITGRTAYFLYFFHYFCFRLSEGAGFTRGWHQGELGAFATLMAVALFLPFIMASAWLWYKARSFLWKQKETPGPGTSRPVA